MPILRITYIRSIGNQFSVDEETSFVRGVDGCHQGPGVCHLPVVGRHEKVGSALLAGAAILGADPEAVGDGAAVPRCG